jgi:hypothetical protein
MILRRSVVSCGVPPKERAASTGRRRTQGQPGTAPRRGNPTPKKHPPLRPIRGGGGGGGVRVSMTSGCGAGGRLRGARAASSAGNRWAGIAAAVWWPEPRWPEPVVGGRSRGPHDRDVMNQSTAVTVHAVESRESIKHGNKIIIIHHHTSVITPQSSTNPSYLHNSRVGLCLYSSSDPVILSKAPW